MSIIPYLLFHKTDHSQLLFIWIITIHLVHKQRDERLELVKAYKANIDKYLV